MRPVNSDARKGLSARSSRHYEKTKGRRQIKRTLLAAGAAAMLLVQQAQGTAITLTASDVSDPNTTSFNGDVGNWSVAGAPSAGNTYSTGAFVLRSPGNGTSYTFGGDSLSIDSGGRFLLKGTGGQVLTVNLILNGGLVDEANGADTFNETLSGTINVAAASTLGALSTETLTINSPISGSAGLQIGGAGANSGADTGVVYFTGNNSAYTGTITLGTVGSGATLSVSADNNLGAPTSGLTFNGGSLQVTGTTLNSFGSHVVTFSPTATVSLDINDAGNTFSTSQILNQTTGGLIKLGAGTLVSSGINTYTGATVVSAGTLTLSGARAGTSGSGTITVGNLASTTATLNIQAGTYALGGNSFVVGAGTSPSTATGIVNQSAGSVTFTGGSQVLIGNAGATGTYNLSAGSISTATSTTRGIILGVNAGSTATFKLSGTGTISAGNAVLEIGRSDALASNTNDTFNQTGGTATFSRLGIGGAAGGSTGVNSTLSLTGGTFTANAFTVLAAGGSNTATITIGGTANVSLAAFPTARGAGSTATLTFDGGTLSPVAASTSYLGGLTHAYLTGNGANFDVPGGNDIVVSQVLEDAPSMIGVLTKADVGVLALSGASTFSGGTTVTAGVLDYLNTAAKPPTGTTAVQAGAVLGLGVGGAGFFSGGDVDNLFAGILTGNLANTTMAAGAGVGIDTTAGDFVYATSQSASRSLTKLGSNKLTLTGANTYSGATSINNGTLTLSGGDNRLPVGTTLSFTGNSGTLDVGPTNQSVAGITFLNLGTTINSVVGSGSLSVTGGNFQLGGGTTSASAAQTLDLTGLQSFNFNNPTGAFNVGGLADANGLTGSGTLSLASNSTITAATMTMGAFSTGSSAVNSGTIHLGQTNTINASSILVGGGKTVDTIDFQTLTNPTLKIRGTGGTDSDRASLTIGTNNSGVLATVAKIDLTSGGTVNGILDAKLGTLLIGQNTRNSTAGSATTGTFAMGMGTLDATTIIVGQQTAVTGTSSSSAATGTFSLSGGLVTVGTLTLADKLSGAAAQTITSNFNLNSGTLDALTIQRGGVGTGAGAATATINFNWVDGTLGNVAGADQTVNGNSAVSGLTGGLTIALSNTGNTSGTHTWDVTALHTATEQSTAILSGAGSLTKVDAGTLALGGANTYTGGTIVNGGTLTALASGVMPTDGAVTVAGGATFAYQPAVAGPLNLGAGILALANGSTIGTVIGGTPGQSAISTTGVATASGSISVAISVIPGVAPTAGVNNLLTTGGGLTGGGATYTPKIYNATNFSGSFAASDTALTFNLATQTALTAAFWKGGLAAGNNVLALSDGVSSNWASDSSGTPTPLVPGSSADVTFSAGGAVNQSAAVLGANMSINSLTLSDSNPVGLNADGHSLTIASATPITVTSASAAVTLNAPIVVSNATSVISVGNSAGLAIGGAISGAATSLTKTGTGTLTLGGTNSYAGTTIVGQGIVAMTADQTLAGGLTFGATANSTTTGALDLSTANATFGGALNVQTNSSTANTITVGAGKTLTINGNVLVAESVTTGNTVLNITGGGAMVVSKSGGTFILGQISGTNNIAKASVDASGLNSFTASLGSGSFILSNTEDNSATGVVFMNLANAGVAPTNSITAATVTVGGAGAGAVQVLTLGSGVNTLNATTLNIGTGARDSGQIVFPGSTGSVSIQGLTSGARTTLNMGTGGATTGAGLSNLLDLNGHDATLLLGTVTIGNQPRSGAVSTVTKPDPNSNTLNFNQGTFDATTLKLAFRTGTTNPAAGNQYSSTVNFGGGMVTIGSGGIELANNTATGANAQALKGTLNISGGTVNVGNSTALGAAIRLANNSAATGGVTATGTVNITGNGVVTLSGDIIKGVATSPAVGILTLDGGTLDMGGHAIGGATPIDTLNFKSGTLQNVSEINAGASPLNKTTTGVLILAGTTGNSYTGGTNVTAGTLLANSANLPVGSAGTGAVNVGDSTGANGFNGVLAGSGNISGSVNVYNGSTISAGSGAASGTTGALALNTHGGVAAGNTAATGWNAGGSYSVKINDAAGTPGSTDGWDTLTMNVLAVPSSGAFTVNLLSLSGTNPGTAANFNGGQNYTWQIAQVAQGTSAAILNANIIASNLVLNTAGFANAPNASGFQLEAFDAGSGVTDLDIVYAPAPEPTSFLTLGLAAGGLLLSGRRGRKQ